jgi:K+-sensing histidine kinase KdpD
MVYFKISSSDGFIIYDNIPPSLWDDYLLKNNNHLSEALVNKNNRLYRCGYSKNEKGSVFILTDDKKYINSKSVFKQFLSFNLLIIESFNNLKNEITQKYNKQTQELIHNLITLNGHNIQEVFALVPQQSLTKNINEQISIVKNKIEKNMEESARTYLRVAKNNMAMKIEFSVFNKLMEDRPSLKQEKHEIRIIILNVLQIFYQDFQEKGIELHLDSSDMELNLDFETITVCFYYLIENAVKYCLPRSAFKIFLLESENCFKVTLDMISLEIKKGEELKLCDQGYCGENAKLLGKNGSGIGLYRAYKTLKLHDATIEIKPRVNSNTQRRHEKLIYEHNSIEIKFPVQKKWA